MNSSNYQADVSAALGVLPARAAEIAAEYPLTSYPFPWVAFSTLVADASFACPALQIDQQTSQRVPAYAYEFNDDTAPPIFTGRSSHRPWPRTSPNSSTCSTCLTRTSPAPPTPASRRSRPACDGLGQLRATGNPATAAVPWPAFRAGSARMLSLIPPQPQLETDFAARHHCAFWAAG